jgi:hypothetical protein
MTAMPEYYDYVLGLIPLALVGVSALFFVGGLALTSAVSAGGVAAVSLVGHALFVRGPTDEPASAVIEDASATREGPVMAD